MFSVDDRHHYKHSQTPNNKKMGESRGAYRVLVGKPGGKRPFGRPTYMWEDGIKTDIREIGLEGLDFLPGKFWVQACTSELGIATLFSFSPKQISW
jgi:hypothetical protein